MTDAHKTTPKADMPRLNPPETAPKGGDMIIACFAGFREMRLAVWCELDCKWQTCTAKTGGGAIKTAWVECGKANDGRLIGWLPWPEVPR
jgi:hypothetical protein